MSKHVTMDFCRDCENHEVNLLSLSEMIEISTPVKFDDFLKVGISQIFSLSVSLIGSKRVDLVNLSTTTKIVLKPLNFLGSLVI